MEFKEIPTQITHHVRIYNEREKLSSTLQVFQFVWKLQMELLLDDKATKNKWI